MKHVKRILSAVIAGALLCTGSVFSTVSAEETAYPSGDVDRDGLCTADDAAITMQYYTKGLVDKNEKADAYFSSIGYDMSTPDEVLAVMDVNDDGSADTNDTVFMLRYYSIEIFLYDSEIEYTSDQLWDYVLAGRTTDGSYAGFLAYLESLRS